MSALWFFLNLVFIYQIAAKNEIWLHEIKIMKYIAGNLKQKKL